MTIPFLDLVVHDSTLRARIDATIKKLLDEGSYIGGAEVSLFAEEFAVYCGGGHCVPVANGTDALILALKALGVGPGDEVITVPFTFIATAEAITMVGATPKFVDINPRNYTMDPFLFEKGITSKTKAVIPVHLFGQPADMDPINGIAHQKGISVIEDAAQAHGAEYKGRRVGTLGDVSCFSFYPTKNLGAFGDGGALVTGSQPLAQKITQLANHGRSAQYFHEVPGLNSRLDSIQAAVLRIFLERLDQSNDRRREIAETYNKIFRQSSWITPPFVESYSKHVFHLYCVETSRRDELMTRLKEKKVGHGIYYPLPLHLQPAYASLGYKKGDFPVSERASERVLSLPLFPTLENEKLKELVRLLNDL